MLARIERTPAWAVAAVLAALYLIIDPPSADLAAQIYRSDYFGREGLALWDNAWYAGHHMPGYSVVFPALGSLIGPRVVGALSAVASAFLFERIADEHFHQAEGRPGIIWFAAATSLNLITGRLAFGLGVAVALATVLAITHRQDVAGLLLAVATTLSSPVAGLFLAMGAAAWWLASREGRALALVAAALLPAAFLSIAFPEGGPEPFVASSFWPALITIGFVLAALPYEERELRIGCGLYALATVAAYAIESPMGGNVVRLGGLFGGPLLACLIWRRRPLILAALALPLLYWQWNAPVRDWVRAHGDPSIHAAYYAPLLGFLARGHGEPFRVEIPFTANHWESLRVAPHYPLARGWERQLDKKYNALFYDDKLDPAKYRRWLDTNAVRYVALSDAPLDGSAKQEDALVRSGRLPWLREVWSGPHWQVFAVGAASQLSQGPAAVTRLGPDSIDLVAARPGVVRLRVHFTPYWAVVRGSGCVERDGDWTRIRVRRAGALRLATRFGFGRIVLRGPRCSG